jgi:hypothetical protein
MQIKDIVLHLNDRLKEYSLKTLSSIILNDWLTEMGFVNGALVQALPEQDGLLVNLANENINYSELFLKTKEKGGSLVRVHLLQRAKEIPVFVIANGNMMLSSGLKIGDALLAGCTHGCIKVRKLNGNIHIGHIGRRTVKPAPPKARVWLSGGWLDDIGFATGTLVTVKSEPGHITFTAHNYTVVYNEIVKFARQNKMRLIQVSKQKGLPVINISGSFIEDAGFNAGDTYAATYGTDSIKLQKFGPEKFGF